MCEYFVKTDKENVFSDEQFKILVMLIKLTITHVIEAHQPTVDKIKCRSCYIIEIHLFLEIN